ncbi:MAG: BLUF domain-containing protein [Alphaproteobacteria bacterium]|nr:BLUF domain-containing protein [Alphaproteobacteria bacterium]MBU1517107.1 BLUF domain-containing protein [Alphaproteobacteria bacterium]MBU2093726.1 BLUF domain-containing protein [Alphaproteobacteria bacterium]MBU2153952.1 BLUF domain-containing protein [Alphaproteobacteria bacterium]MBU2308674.1 BLUF domain-containing protein [Alphaproteobacteria bacterium]
MSEFSAISGVRSLHRLIYASRQRIAPADLEHEVGAIIRASIRNNREASLTGLLLIHDGWFIQALEGPAEAVMTTYRRIIDDPRHVDTKVLSAGPATSREFADWNMCARHMSASDDAILDALALRAAFRPDTLSATSALRLLKAVRGIQERTASAAVG